MSDPQPANELAKSSSAYLRSAAHQPVRWNEWGDAAFEKAKLEDKPILLDIGAVWCHWCHVMDRESYENQEIARLINESYIPVKVDRDDRPDIDARYQLAVSALTGQGGWPLTAFLTPQGKTFYGGTYFPPDDRFGRPGMKRILESIAQNYQAHRPDILSSADRISEALHGVETLHSGGGGAGRDDVEAIIASIRQMFDAQHGGFGTAPKFPHPSGMDLLLDAYLETRQDWLLSIINVTLEHMGRGGVYDQIGGGFHRYSVDERWVVPHFEKMSYDNAGLLGNYLRAYQVTGNEFFREIALGILEFIKTVLSSPEGGFFSSQDADYGLDDDGDYFTWTLDEVKAALNEREAAVVAQYYHVEPAGEMHHNPAKNVLFIDQPVEAIAARLKLSTETVAGILPLAKERMLAARAKRPTPFVDTTIYASWNGMMISVLLDTYKVFGLKEWCDRALRTLDLIIEKAHEPAKGFGHALTRMPGGQEADRSPVSQLQVSNFDLLDDQVFMAGALLDAYEVTGERKYFDLALNLMDTTIKRFWDAEHGGFFDTAHDTDKRQGALTMLRKAFQDSPTPAPNAQAVLVLDRLARLADRPDFVEKAKATLDLFAAKARQYGLFAATYGLALVNHLRPAIDIVVIGPRGDARRSELLAAAHRAPLAGKRVLVFDFADLKARNLPSGLSATLPKVPFDDVPMALVCEGRTCHRPVETSAALADLLKRIQAPVRG
ncbi:MAG TPA: thioredoxin domain-containing protein [Terriglobia bacterium]|nr:thioredoxin domain-containing protein [Terriglobia bacterium]